MPGKKPENSFITEERRREIISSDALSAENIAELNNVSKCTGYRMVKQIKEAGYDRLSISGVVATQDYIDYYKLDISRYIPFITEAQYRALKGMKQIFSSDISI